MRQKRTNYLFFSRAGGFFFKSFFKKNSNKRETRVLHGDIPWSLFGHILGRSDRGKVENRTVKIGKAVILGRQNRIPAF